MVRRIEVDGKGQTTGVRWHDRETGQLETAKAPLVFLCASSLETTRILMLSELGARSDALGRYLMDHVMQKAEGVGPGLAGEPTSPEDGRCTFLPRFNDRENGRIGADAGFGVQVYQTSGMAGQSWFTAVAFAEMAPRSDNRVMLDHDRKDAWGAPVLRIRCSHGDTDLAHSAERARALSDLAEITGSKLSRLDIKPVAPGSAVHECGTARMGEDPAHSVLDPFNACWDARGLYVTDGASLPSQGFQNPTLTIMALTARAVDHALKAQGAVNAIAATR
jgi:choline dehydrogenase-like flavoprotein